MVASNLAAGEQGGRVLIVDDDGQVRGLLAFLLAREGHSIEEAGTAEEALERLRKSPPDLILLDLNLPGRSGLDVLRVVRASAATRLLPVVMMTGGGTPGERIDALKNGVTDFLSKPFLPDELLPRVRALLNLKTYTDALEDAERVIVALAKAIDARDAYTSRHSERVSFYAGLLGERIGLAGRELFAVQRGGLFHDLGKIAIRDAVLLKPGELTPEERLEIERHPVEGRKLIEHMKTLSYALDVVYHHHERFDGSGYPSGLSGEAIPITARVTTIADIYDALTTARVYRAALSREEALAIMQAEARKGWWDSRLLEEFRALAMSRPPSGERPMVPAPVVFPNSK